METSEREAFEAWETNDGAYPAAVRIAPDGGYLLMKASVDWNTWQAACKWQREQIAALPITPTNTEGEQDGR